MLDKVMKAVGYSQSSGPVHSGAAQAPTQDSNGNSMQDVAKTAMNMWNSYGSPYLASLAGGHSSSSAPPTPASTTSLPQAVGSSSAVQSSPFSAAVQSRNGFAPEAQVPLPATPEEINRAHQTPGSESSTNIPPSFPIPQHFQ